MLNDDRIGQASDAIACWSGQIVGSIGPRDRRLELGVGHAARGQLLPRRRIQASNSGLPAATFDPDTATPDGDVAGRDED